MNTQKTFMQVYGPLSDAAKSIHEKVRKPNSDYVGSYP